MKKYLAMILAVCMLLLCTACSEQGDMAAANDQPTAPKQDEGGNIEDVPLVYYVGPLGGTGFTEMQLGFEDAIAELGWEGYYVGQPLSTATNEGMMEITQSCITNGADGVLGYYGDFSYVRDMLRNAKANGTLVGLAGGIIEDGDEEVTDFMLSPSAEQVALMQAEAMADMIGDKEGTVVFFQSQLNNAGLNYIYSILEDYFKDISNISLIGQYESGADATNAAELIADLRKATPEINGVIICDGTGTAGVANYIAENGLEEDMYFVAMDYSQELFQYIKDGVVDCTICQDFYAQGYNGPFLFKQLMEGQEVDIEQAVDAFLVDQSNVEEYAAMYGYQLD